MKKYYIPLVLALLMILPVSCNKESVGAGKEDEVYLYASDASKSVINADWTVSWTATDKLSVFNAPAGTADYSENCRFDIDGDPSENRFKHNSGTLKEGAVKDWYVCSPYLSSASQPGTTSGGYTVAINPSQAEYDYKSHLSTYDLMVGTDKGVPDGKSPSAYLHHVCTILQFHVTNESGKSTKITGITLDAGDGGTFITGSFSMDYDNCALTQNMGTSSSYTCNLTVKNPTTVADGEAVDLYMIVAPFSMEAGKKIKLTIKAGAGDCFIDKTVPAGGISFKAGEHNNANISYKPSTVVFTETFGTTPFPTASVPSYDHKGLITSDPAGPNYEYSVTGNSSIATDKIDNPNWSSYIEGAAVKIVAKVATGANSAIYIKGITVEPNTTYIFSYNKSKGKVKNGSEFESNTQFKYRKPGASSWTLVNPTSDAGTITQEFTTGNYTTLDIGVESTTRLTLSDDQYAYYPAVDLFKLIRKQ